MKFLAKYKFVMKILTKQLKKFENNSDSIAINRISEHFF